MNWEHYRNILSSAQAFPAPNAGKIVNQTLPAHARHGYPTELKGTPTTSMFYQHPYLSYLAPKAKEFRPTVVTRPIELGLKQESLQPARTSSTGSNENSLMGSPNSRHVCQVCGDSASGVHYGVQTCEGCKSFFKRSLQGKGQSFVCAADNKCQVDKRLRRNCAACRLRVCHQVGMKSNGVRKRKMDKSDKLPNKMSRMETIEKQLELRDCSPIMPQMSRSPIQHHLPLSPVSLSSSPSSPELPEVRNSYSPKVTHSRKNGNDLSRDFRHQLNSQFETKDTIALEAADYTEIDRSLESSTALSQLFQHEIPRVVHWAKTIPDYKSLPIEDQIYLTRNRCLDLLVMSVVAQSCANNQGSDTNGIHFSLTDEQYKDMITENGCATAKSSVGIIREKILKTTMAPLKNYASETFNNLLKTVTHYHQMNASRLELETLKLMMFTNTDASVESNVKQIDLLHDMRSSFRSNLRLLCIDNYGRDGGERRYDDLLFSMSMVKELSTRLECCMTQQSEVVSNVSAICEALA